MRVTTGPPRDVVTVVAAAALALNVVLLVTTVGGAASPDDAADTFTPPAAATTTLDAGLVNPWAAGDAAVLRALAEVGGAGPNGCPGPTSASDPPS
jgi:hypothetical protein